MGSLLAPIVELKAIVALGSMINGEANASLGGANVSALLKLKLGWISVPPT
jgi:hypothetical protein